MINCKRKLTLITIYVALEGVMELSIKDESRSRKKSVENSQFKKEISVKNREKKIAFENKIHIQIPKKDLKNGRKSV